MSYTTLGGRKLQHWCSIDIELEEETQYVYFNSDFHINRRKQMPVSYAKEFSHAEILRDSSLIKSINDHYGKVTMPDESPF